MASLPSFDLIKLRREPGKCQEAIALLFCMRVGYRKVGQHGGKVFEGALRCQLRTDKNSLSASLSGAHLRHLCKSHTQQAFNNKNNERMLYENKVSSEGERGGGCGSWIVRVNVFMKESKTGREESRRRSLRKSPFRSCFQCSRKVCYNI